MNNNNLEKAFSISIHDCDVQTFKAGGPGGQNQNKRDTGVRVIHRPSGAVAESREERSQLQNKKIAFHRMANSPKMRIWIHRELYLLGSIEDQVAREMNSKNLIIEGRESGTWERLT